MGASISKEKIESMSTKKLLSLKASTVRDLRPEVSRVYEQRMSMRLVSMEKLKGYTDEQVQNLQWLYPSDIKPDVLAFYKQRVCALENRQQLQELLKTMEPVLDGEDMKTDHEEEKKSEEKKLYEVDHVYRT